MITTIKRNDLKFNLPTGFGYERWTNEDALKLVNSPERKLIINGFTVASQNENDLNYIHDLFTDVRIKKAFINSVRFLVIEYATNYSIAYDNVSKYERKKFFIDFTDLLDGLKTVEDVNVSMKHFEIKKQKQQARYQARTIKNKLKETRNRLKKQILEEKMNAYPTIKDTYGNTLYIVDGVAHSKYSLLGKYHFGLWRV